MASFIESFAAWTTIRERLVSRPMSELIGFPGTEPFANRLGKRRLTKTAKTANEFVRVSYEELT